MSNAACLRDSSYPAYELTVTAIFPTPFLQDNMLCAAPLPEEPMQDACQVAHLAPPRRRGTPGVPW